MKLAENKQIKENDVLIFIANGKNKKAIIGN